MATTLARQAIENGTAPSVTVTSAYRVSVDEFLLIYTRSAAVHADIFKVPAVEDQAILAAGAGDGEHMNVVVAAGSSDLTGQPLVTAATLVTE